MLKAPTRVLSDVALRDELHTVRRRTETVTGALQEIRTLRREIQLELRGHEAGSPARTALGRRQAALDNRLARLSSDRQALYRTEADLRSESTLRRQLTGQSWYREHAQRDALATSGPALDGDTARSRWEAASVVDRHVWLEARRRTLDPDLGINQRPTGTPGWAVPGRGLTDPSMPKSWVEPLTAMGQQVSNAITTRGAALALDPPAWSTTYLGAVPADATRRARWESLAGQIETWRGLTDHQDPVKALPTPRASHDASRQAVRDLHVLHAAAADLRRDSLRAGLDALIPPAGEPTPGLRVPQTALEGATERVPLPHPAPSIADRVTALTQRVAGRALLRYLEARGDLHRQAAGAAQRAADLRTAPLAPGERLDDRIAQAKAAEAEAATRRLALQPDGAARVLAAARQTLIGRGQRRLATLAQNAPTIDVLHRRVDAQRLADQLRPQNQNQAKQQRDRGLDR